MRVIIAVLMVMFSVSCSGSRHPIGQVGDYLNAGLPAPNSIEARSVSAVVDHLDGTEYTGGGNISIDGPAALFFPVGDRAGEVAFGLYTFSLEGFEQGRYLEQSWTVAPEPGTLWIGLGDRVRNRWEWLRPAHDESLLIGNLAPYLSELDELHVVVLLTGDGQFKLESIAITGRPPHVFGVSPTFIAPGAQEVMTVMMVGTGDLTYVWDFGGAVTPNSSTEESPAVTALAEGIYECSLAVSNILGSDLYNFEIEIDATILEGQLIAVALDKVVTTADIATVLVKCGDFPAGASFTYMSGVAVTWEAGADYAPLTFNLGAVGGAAKDVDGVWSAMDPVPIDFLLSQETSLGSAPVNGELGRLYVGFNVTPLFGSDIVGGGELFNFGLSFTAAGTYTLGFLEFQDVKRTYYSDSETNEYNWVDITNNGAWNTITVTDT